MAILPQQTLLFTEERLTFLQADFPVNPFPLPEREEAQKMTVSSGRKCIERFARFPHVGSWQRMFVGSLLSRKVWYSSACALIWKLRGMSVKRFLFLLAASEHPTVESECGLLPTVQAQGLKVCENGQSKFLHASLLPTPTSTDKGSGRVNRSLSKGAAERPTLALMARKKLLPTPKAQDCRHALYDRGKSNLGEKIAEKFGGGDFADFPTQSPVCCGDDGLSSRLDTITFPTWRRESIKAYGNAIVPQVFYQIGLTINEYENTHTT